MVPARHRSGDALAGGRTFRCARCEFPITLLESDEPPACPRCGEERFEPASIFSGETMVLPAPAVESAPDWLPEVRAALAGKGPHVAWDTGEEVDTAYIREGLTHLGRSFQAEIQLLEPTISRRHAVIHRTGDTAVLLDDHSLNGVFVRGSRVEWQPLADGDEIELGRFRLHFIDVERPPGRFRH
jgi:hypothetical protein